MECFIKCTVYQYETLLAIIRLIQANTNMGNVENFESLAFIVSIVPVGLSCRQSSCRSALDPVLWQSWKGHFIVVKLSKIGVAASPCIPFRTR